MASTTVMYQLMQDDKFVTTVKHNNPITQDGDPYYVVSLNYDICLMFSEQQFAEFQKAVAGG